MQCGFTCSTGNKTHGFCHKIFLSATLIYILLKVHSFIKCFNLRKVVRTHVDDRENQKEKIISQAIERHQHMRHPEMQNFLNNPQLHQWVQEPPWLLFHAQHTNPAVSLDCFVSCVTMVSWNLLKWGRCSQMPHRFQNAFLLLNGHLKRKKSQPYELECWE